MSVILNKSQNIRREQYKKMGMLFGNTSNVKTPIDNQTEKWKLFERYVDGIICKVRNDPNNLHQLCNNLH